MSIIEDLRKKYNANKEYTKTAKYRTILGSLDYAACIGKNEIEVWWYDIDNYAIDTLKSEGFNIKIKEINEVSKVYTISF